MKSTTAKEFLITTVLVSAFVGLSYGLDCYYCDPADKGCDEPLAAGRETKDCRHITGDDETMSRVLDQERGRIQAGETISYLCASLNVINKDDKNSSGIYRTCFVNTTTSDQCNTLKDQFLREGIGRVVECKTCDESYCNNMTVDAFKNASPESFTSVLLYTFLSCIFVVYVI